MVWYDIVWCGMIDEITVLYDMLWYDEICGYMAWYDVTSHSMVYGMIWYDE